MLAGLRADRLTGKFHLPNPTTPTFGTLDADQAISVSFTHSGSLSQHEYASIQCAVLHTTTDGQRRVRVINLALQVTELAADVFRYADMDVVVAHLMRQSKSIFAAIIDAWIYLSFVSYHPHADFKTIPDSGRVDRAVLLNLVFVSSELRGWNHTDPSALH